MSCDIRDVRTRPRSTTADLRRACTHKYLGRAAMSGGGVLRYGRPRCMKEAPDVTKVDTAILDWHGWPRKC